MATYKSGRRQRQAEATRQEILQAARRLFVERGYANTTMSDIAAEADVAVQTIYTSCGSKRDLALALNDLIDEEAGVAELAAQARTADDPRKVIALSVALTRQIHERCADLVMALTSAAAVEPDAAAAVEDGMARHRAGTAGAGRRLEKLGALRNGVSAEEAGAALAVLTSAAVWSQLTVDHGWSLDESQRWIEESVARLLLQRR
jgi:AcrR family transcriptional regulator